MFRVMELRDGAVRVYESTDLIAPPELGVLRWIDLRAQDAAALELIRARFDLHPMSISHCAQIDRRPKLDEYRDHLFLVTQGFAAAGEKLEVLEELEVLELHAFLGERFLITVHLESIPALDRTWDRLEHEPKLLERGVDFAYYLVADGIVDDIFPLLDLIADELDELEDAILGNPKRHHLRRIFALKHQLVQMRKVLSPQRDVLGMLAKRGDSRISERTVHYLRDVYDHLVRINESIETNRDLLSNALDAYLSAVGQRTNEIMKYLTVMSAVFLPLAFVVGFFGMNFDNLPGLQGWVHSDALMWIMIGVCISTPAMMLAWFKYKRWL